MSIAEGDTLVLSIRREPYPFHMILRDVLTKLTSRIDL